MKYIKNCPLCNSSLIMPVYSKRAVFQKGDVLGEDIQFRNFFLDHVLEADSVLSRYILCFNCSFMFYNPRLEQHEMDRLYNQNYLDNIRRYAPNFGGNADTVTTGPPLERSTMIAEIVSNHGKLKQSGKILDYGGSNGYNLRAFSDLSTKCVMDPSVAECLPGMHKVQSVKEQAPYDLVISTHVLEHLIEPGVIIHDLVDGLCTDGLFYLEVPYEFPSVINGKYTLGQNEHINFFSTTSIRNLGSMMGLDCLYLDIKTYPIGTDENNTWDTTAICALFRKTEKTSAHINRRYIYSFAGECLQYMIKRFNKRRK